MPEAPRGEAGPEPASLAALGVTPEEEACYEALLAQPEGGSPQRIARAVGLSVAAAREALRHLAERRLVVRSVGNRYVPAPPQAAVEALVLEQRLELERARLAASHLEEAFMRTPRTPTDLLEIVSGRAPAVEYAVQLQRAAQTAVYRVEAEDTPGLSSPDLRIPLARRGVITRAIYPRDSLLEGEGAAPAGPEQREESRFHRELPATFVIVDRRVGLVLSASTESSDPGGFLVRGGPLLQSLVSLWALLWNTSTPNVNAVSGEQLTDDLSTVLQRERELITLVLAGFKVQAIARKLGLGSSTVHRRLRALMEAAGADTAVQLGYRLAHLDAQNG